MGPGEPLHFGARYRHNFLPSHIAGNFLWDNQEVYVPQGGARDENPVAPEGKAPRSIIQTCT